MLFMSIFEGLFYVDLMVQSGCFLCSAFCMYLIEGLALMACRFFVGLVFTIYFWGFGYGTCTLYI